MAITGTVNLITDASAFFQPLLLNNAKKPTGGYKPFTGTDFSVVMTGSASPGHDQIVTAAGDAATGAFTVPEFNASFGAQKVGFDVRHGNTTLYRSTVVEYSRAVQGGLDIYLLQPSPVPISAGAISTALSKAASSLPGNTSMTANPWGFGFAGNRSGADIQFGVGLTAHTSTNLSVFLELDLVNWNVHVGFPADCGTNAHDIVEQIRQTLAKEDSDVNAFVQTQLLTQVQKVSPALSLGTLAEQLLGIVSVTVGSIVFPNKHTWPLSNTNDTTTVLTIGVTVGFPRTW